MPGGHWPGTRDRQGIRDRRARGEQGTGQTPSSAPKVNGKPAETATDFAELAQLGGDSKRALRFAVPLDSLRSGRNEIRLAPKPGSEAQKVVWVEMRIEP